MKTVYLLDTNVLLTAYNTYYAFDIAPKFWIRLNEKAASGDFVLIDRVYDELKKQKDEISHWISNEFRGEIKSSKTQLVSDSYSKIITYVSEHEQYKESAKAEFASVADSWLIAHAKLKAYNYTIVTLEAYNPDAKAKIKIPNICKELDIPYIDTFEFIRAVGIVIT